jgi:hypothetical protein
MRFANKTPCYLRHVFSRKSSRISFAKISISTIENLSSVLAHWPQLGEYKVKLFAFCEMALGGLEKLRKEIEEKEMKVLHSLKIRIPPLGATNMEPVTKNELGIDSSEEDKEPPRKKWCFNKR